jgi:hypothetical protein
MKSILLALVLLLTGTSCLYAQFRTYESNRIAISGDGNSAPDYQHKWPTGDPDDWGAVPAMLATLAKVNLQKKLVHFSYNNFMEAPAGPDDKNQMKIGADGAIERWGYEAARFFDITNSLEEAKSNLQEEIQKSSETDPLYFIHMGLSEFFYQVVKEVVDAGNEECLAHVYIVSHSGFNDTHLRRDYHHTLFEAMEYGQGRMHYQKIKDQNGKWDPNLLWNSGKDFSPWYWMRDHPDPDVRWIYERMLAHTGGVADISDTGMLYWLLTGDEDGNPAKFREFIGEGILQDFYSE